MKGPRGVMLAVRVGKGGMCRWGSKLIRAIIRATARSCSILMPNPPNPHLQTLFFDEQHIHGVVRYQTLPPNSIPTFFFSSLFFFFLTSLLLLSRLLLIYLSRFLCTHNLASSNFQSYGFDSTVILSRFHQVMGIFFTRVFLSSRLLPMQCFSRTPVYAVSCADF